MWASASHGVAAGVRYALGRRSRRTGWMRKIEPGRGQEQTGETVPVPGCGRKLVHQAPSGPSWTGGRPKSGSSTRQEYREPRGWSFGTGSRLRSNRRSLALRSCCSDGERDGSLATNPLPESLRTMSQTTPEPGTHLRGARGVVWVSTGAGTLKICACRGYGSIVECFSRLSRAFDTRVSECDGEFRVERSMPTIDGHVCRGRRVRKKEPGMRLSR